MKPGIFDPWRQETARAPEQTISTTAQYSPEADPEEQRFVRFVGKRGGLRVSLTQPEEGDVDDTKLTATAVAVLIDCIYEVSKQFPEALENTAISLGNVSETDYTVVLRDGVRCISILSPSIGDQKYPRAFDILSSFFRDRRSHPGISAIAAARRILTYAK